MFHTIPIPITSIKRTEASKTTFKRLESHTPTKVQIITMMGYISFRLLSILFSGCLHAQSVALLFNVKCDKSKSKVGFLPKIVNRANSCTDSRGRSSIFIEWRASPPRVVCLCSTSMREEFADRSNQSINAKERKKERNGNQRKIRNYACMMSPAGVDTIP